SDIFLTRINADGSYGGTKTIGGTEDDYGQSVAVDIIGNVYITGSFQQTVDFDPDGIGDSRTAVRSDIFLTRINADGSYGGTKTIGGTEDDYGQSVAVDSDGNVYIAGSFQQTVDFDPDGIGDSRTAVRSDIFITKINADGSYGGTKTIGGTEDDYGQSVAVDNDGNVYIAGSFQQTVDFDPDGIGDSRTAVRSDIFITKIKADGSYGGTKTIGGTEDDYGQSVAVDIIGNVYITGSFQQTVDFDPGTGTDNFTAAGLSDIFLTRINADGSYGWTRTMGGTDQDFGQSVAVDSSVNVFVTGNFSGTGVNFDPDKIESSRTSAGLSDIFMTKFRIVGFEVRPTGISTVDGGGTASFTVRLSSEPLPLSDVTIPVRSSDTTKGTIDKSSLTFTSLDWNKNQTVIVTSMAGSTQRFTIILDPASSDDNDYDGLDPADVTVNSLGSDSDGSGCFIATAAYGSPMVPHIKLLSQFRDRFLLSSKTGKKLVRIYYTHSPAIADFIKKHDNLRALVRLGLIPFLGLAWVFLKAGSISTIAFLLLFGACCVAVLRCKKYNKFRFFSRFVERIGMFPL
ncbi:MAG: CFI-box-CTERM domain-containing protein, partial [Desulfobacterales bacterium]